MKRLLAALVLAALPAFAWNGTGHRIVAAIAYDQLTPQARIRVDDLIRRHPDYALFLEFAPAEPAARARAAFIAASMWADQIKFDARFKRPQTHGDWHFINIPFSTDGTPLREAPTPNVVTALEQLSRNPNPENLVWMIHLVGDIHNPLHTAARFSRETPDGDRGGNDVFVRPGRNLHSYWDGLPGPESAGLDYVNQRAKPLASGSSPDLRKGFADWAKEGVDLAKSLVHSMGDRSGSTQNPLRISAEYQAQARVTADRQLALAGNRLAGLLNRLQ